MKVKEEIIRTEKECVEVGLQGDNLVLRKKVSTFNGGECINILSTKEKRLIFYILLVPQ